MIGRRVKTLVNRLTTSIGQAAESGAGWVFSLMFYTAACTVSLIVSTLPLQWQVRAGAVVVVSVVLASITTVRYRFAGASEPEIVHLQQERDQLERDLETATEKIGTLELEIRASRIKFLDAEWIWEINFGKLNLNYEKIFDYYCAPGHAVTDFSGRAKDIPEGAIRYIGALQVDYQAKVGVDLRDIKISLPVSGNRILYAMPAPAPTGILNAELTWWTKARCDYVVPLMAPKHWRVADSTADKFFSDQGEQALKHITRSGELDPTLSRALDFEAQRRLEGFFRLVLGLEGTRVEEHQLSAPTTLGEYLGKLSLSHGTQLLATDDGT